MGISRFPRLREVLREPPIAVVWAEPEMPARPKPTRPRKPLKIRSRLAESKRGDLN